MLKIFLTIFSIVLILIVGSAVFISLTQAPVETGLNDSYGNVPPRGDIVPSLGNDEIVLDSSFSLGDSYDTSSDIQDPIFTTPDSVIGFPDLQLPLVTTPPLPTAPPIKTDAPVILSVIPSIITNVSQEITITGENFSNTGNTIFTSSESAKAFVNLPSLDGKDINLTFHFSAGETLKKAISDAATQSSLSYTAVVASVVSNIKLSVNGPVVTHVPVTLFVRNKNGDSNVVTLSIDMASVLQK